MTNRTNWLSRPTGLLLIVLAAFAGKVQAQDKYFGQTGFINIFSIHSDGTNLKNEYSFNFNSDGTGGLGNLVNHNGLLYGITRYGVNPGNGGYGYGNLFSFDPYTDTHTVLYSLNGGSDGDLSFGGGQLIEYPDGKLYGTSNQGGSYGTGTLFSWDPATSTFTKLHDMQGGGSNLTMYNYTLYGATSSGGANGAGYVFSFDPRTNNFKALYDLGQPGASFMFAYQNKLYGLLQGAGPTGSGIIFSYDPVSGILAPVYSFDGTHGGSPYQIMLYKNKFYGTTRYGGANTHSGSNGVLFSFDPASGIYTDLYDMTGHYGSFLGFVIDSSGKMFGTIQGGGQFGNGSLFQFDLNSQTYTQGQDMGFIQNPIAGLTFVPGRGGTASQTLTFNNITAKTYGDPDFPGGATAASGLPVTYTSSDLSVAWTNGNLIHITGVGTCTITATQRGNSMYAPVSARQTLTVGKASLLIRANDTMKYQYQPLPVFTLTYTGFVNGDTATSLLTQPVISTSANTNSPQGQYPIVVAGATSNNYTITYQNGLLTIAGQSQNISFTDTVKSYGDTDFATASVNTGLPVTYTSSNPAVAMITADGKIHITGAGSDMITVSQAGNATYGSVSQSFPLTVLPASLSIKVNNETSVYQQSPPAFSAVYTGLVNGDTPESLQTVFSSVGSDPKAAPGVYLIFALAISPADSVNYRVVSNQPGSLLITPADGDKNNLDAWFSSQSSLQINIFATMQTPPGQHVALQVFDMTGRPIVNTGLSLAWGYNSLTLPISNAPAGVYIIRVAGDMINLSKTITKLL